MIEQEKEKPVQGTQADRTRVGVLRGIGLSAAVLALTLSAGCQSLREVRDSGKVIAPAGHGPKVTFQNASSKTLEVRYWVGKRDVNNTPGGDDVMTPVAFRIEPGEQRMHDVGRANWPTGNLDAVVRVQVNLVEDGERAAGVDPWWFEFERPAPYSIRAVNASQTRRNLDFETWGEGNLFIVPTDQWIPDHHGLYPVYETED